VSGCPLLPLAALSRRLQRSLTLRVRAEEASKSRLVGVYSSAISHRNEPIPFHRETTFPCFSPDSRQSEVKLPLHLNCLLGLWYHNCGVSSGESS
jgi:hypothetical protein